jgi:hypothetical protein
MMRGFFMILFSIPLLSQTNPQPETTKVSTGNLWTSITNFGQLGDPHSLNYSYTWPGGVRENYHLWIGCIWIGSIAGGDTFVTIFEWPSSEWSPGSAIVVDSLGKSDRDYLTTIRDMLPNPNNEPGRVMGLSVELRLLSWEREPLKDCIAYEFSIVYKKDYSGLPGPPDTLKDVVFTLYMLPDVSGADTSAPHVDDLIAYDGWDGDCSSTDERDEITLLPDGTYLNKPDGYPDEWIVFGDEPEEVTLSGDTILVSRNTVYVFDSDDPAYPGDDTGENGLCPGYIGFSLIYAPPSPSDSIWVENGDTLRMPLPLFYGWYIYSYWPSTDEERYRWMRGYWYNGTQYRFIPEPDSLGGSAFDYSFILSMGPFNIADGETIDIVIGSAIGYGLNGGFDNFYSGGRWVPGLRHRLDYLFKAYYSGSTSSDPFHPSSPREDFHWGPISIPEYRSRFDVIAYPNPSKGEVYIEFEIERISTISVFLYNVSGRRVKEFKYTIDPGYYRFPIKIEGVSGVYFLKARIGKFEKTQKIVLLK